MNERIKELRKALNLTQQAFADRIGTKRNTVAQYEIGRIEPSTAVISLICREFHVNETWLRTGEGDMFTQQSRGDAIRAFVDDLLNDQEDSFRLHFVSRLTKLSDHEWTVLARLAERLAAENELFSDGTQNTDSVAEKASRFEDEMDADVSGLSVEELEKEYKKRASGSASTWDSAASNTTGDKGSGVA